MYPMQNQATEEDNKVVKNSDEEIKTYAINKKNKDGYPIGCMVENMKPYILSDICLIFNDDSIPSIKECYHSGRKALVWQKIPIISYQLTTFSYISE